MEMTPQQYEAINAKLDKMQATIMALALAKEQWKGRAEQLSQANHHLLMAFHTITCLPEIGTEQPPQPPAEASPEALSRKDLIAEARAKALAGLGVIPPAPPPAKNP